MSESIALASDHAGYILKQHLVQFLRERGFNVHDLGAHDERSVDYPEYADVLVSMILSSGCSRGILVCGTGIGMSIRANRHRGIRAANCSDLFSVRMARAHNDANVLTLGSRIIAPELAEELVRVFLETPYDGGRHQRRVEMLDEPSQAET